METSVMNLQKFRPEWLVIREYLRTLHESSDYHDVMLDLYAMADILRTSFYKLQDSIEALESHKLITTRKERGRIILTGITVPPSLIEEYHNKLVSIAEKRQLRALEKSGYRR